MAPTRRASIHTGIAGSEGSVVIIVMMFILVILALGVGLFSMVKFSLAGTELERKEVKAFNVAEAGIDTGMRTLKLQWPASTPVSVDETAFRSQFDSANFPNPTGGAGDFINVAFHDDDNQTDELGPPTATSPAYDANGNGRMWVDSEATVGENELAAANVSNDRHRIMVLTQRETWNLSLPFVAMYANQAGANGQGLRVRIDPNQSTSPTNVMAYYQSLLGNGINDDPPNIIATQTGSTFDDLIREALIHALAGIAQNQGTYYDDDGTTPWPSIADGITELKSVDAPGEIIYMKSTAPIVIAANTQLGSRTSPIVLVLDSPGINDLDFRGTADFYGIILSTGSILVRGTSSFWGQVLARDAIDSKGGGSSPEINYNLDIINLINQTYTISVAIVPNTWEEYTVAR